MIVDGRPNNDRSWTECFAQLVGTILSLWDAAALDAAGQDGEVAPKFINLADASIKMVGHKTHFIKASMINASILDRNATDKVPGCSAFTKRS